MKIQEFWNSLTRYQCDSDTGKYYRIIDSYICFFGLPFLLALLAIIKVIDCVEWLINQANKLVLLIALIALTLATLSAEELKWENLSQAQKDVAFRIYEIAKPINYEMTMIAIAWQESRLGKTPINLQDPSCGVHHIQITNYLRLNGLKDTSLNRNIYCNTLINDIELSTITAIEIFKTFKAFHKGVYASAIKSYNGGYRFDSNEQKRYATDRYYKEVYHNVKILESLRHSVFEKQGKTNNSINSAESNMLQRIGRR